MRLAPLPEVAVSPGRALIIRDELARLAQEACAWRKELPRGGAAGGEDIVEAIDRLTARSLRLSLELYGWAVPLPEKAPGQP